MENKRALVISGGGAKGAFAAGAIKYIMIELGLNFDIVVGTSTGALIAPLVASKDISNLVHFYENVEKQDILKNRPDIFAFLFSDSLNDTKPLKRLIENFFGDKLRYRRLIESPTELFVTVVNMQTGAIDYGNQHRDSKSILLKKILASASIPVLMPPVKIARHQYIDGGVKEIAPLSKAIIEGATSIISIILSPAQENRKPVKREFKNAMDILKRTIELLTDEILDNDLKIANLYSEAIGYIDRIKKNAKDILGLKDSEIKRLFSGVENPFSGKRILNIITIRPDEELMESSLDFDPGKMRDMVVKGYIKAKEVLNHLDF